ncbi:MAG TPA: adenylate kinase [Streptosporangiaceae bacterium]|nr:adenylate kinase [Streptosporangiaceae bacterium]
MRVVLMGPPGSGKGTQGERLAARYGVPAISTGSIFRDNLTAGTELGRLAQEYMSQGKYVPDEVTNTMVRERLDQPDAARGFLLDGYPRTTAQVDELDDILRDHGVALEAVIELVADVEELVDRLLRRAHEQGREDDTEETIRTRQKVYADQTAPLTRIYADRGMLLRVDGVGEMDVVAKRLSDTLDAFLG